MLGKMFLAEGTRQEPAWCVGGAARVQGPGWVGGGGDTGDERKGTGQLGMVAGGHVVL